MDVRKELVQNEPLASRFRRKRKFGHFVPYIIAGGIFGTDQITKLIAENVFAPYESGKQVVVIEGWLRFLWFKNTGASFGLLSDQPWVFTVLASVVAIGIIIWYEVNGTSNTVYRVVTGMMLAGTIGNLADRIFKNGAVTDFINIPNLQALFKNFNLADMSLTFGVAVILIYTIYRFFKPEQREV